MRARSRPVRASGFRRYGGPEVLEVVDVEIPDPSPVDVVVRVAAATVNPVDVKMRNGAQAAKMTDLRPPYVAGMEFAGHVDRVGSSVRGLSLGDPVMGVVAPRRAEGGAHAEYVRAPAVSVTKRFRGLDLVQAATVPMNGLTAARALHVLALPRGATLLVTGGAGAVGGYVVQLAKVAGLEVVADAHPEDAALLRRLGADRVVPRGPGMTDAVLADYPAGVDGAVDAARLGADTARAVKDGGMLAAVQPIDPNGDDRVHRRYISALNVLGDTALLHRLAELGSDGSITPRVAQVLPFTEAPEAHRLLEAGGVRGRVVLSFDEEYPEAG